MMKESSINIDNFWKSQNSRLIHVPCPVCMSEEHIEVYSSTIPLESAKRIDKYSYDILLDGHLPIVKCQECGLHYTCPRDAQEDLTNAYVTGNVESYLSESVGKLSSFRREAHFLKKLCKRGGKLLEIGCATGLFLQAAREEGFDVWGCDPWHSAVTVAQKAFGGRVRAGMFNVEDYKPEYFQVITLWDVIEHVEEPLKLIHNVYDLLAPGGWLAMSTPNFDSFSRLLLKKHWQFFERPHLVFFSPKTLSTLLYESGFSSIDFRSQWKTYSISYFVKYLAKWSPTFSNRLLKLNRQISLSSNLLITLPSGCMRVYAQKSTVL